jgi:hypothetical protein
MLDKPKQSLDDLIHQLNVLSAEEFDTEVAKIRYVQVFSFFIRVFNFSKNQLYAHSMKDALFAELCEIKARTGTNFKLLTLIHKHYSDSRTRHR